MDSQTDQFDIQQSINNQDQAWGSASDDTFSIISYSDIGTESGSAWYTFGDEGQDSMSGSASESANTYTLGEWDDITETGTLGVSAPNGSFAGSATLLDTFRWRRKEPIRTVPAVTRHRSVSKKKALLSHGLKDP